MCIQLYVYTHFCICVYKYICTEFYIYIYIYTFIYLYLVPTEEERTQTSFLRTLLLYFLKAGKVLEEKKPETRIHYFYQLSPAIMLEI